MFDDMIDKLDKEIIEIYHKKIENEKSLKKQKKIIDEEIAPRVILKSEIKEKLMNFNH